MKTKKSAGSFSPKLVHPAETSVGNAVWWLAMGLSLVGVTYALYVTYLQHRAFLGHRGSWDDDLPNKE